jgi:hypothetical protein
MVTQGTPRGTDAAPADAASLAVPLEETSAGRAEDVVEPREAPSGESSPASDPGRRGRALAPYVLSGLALLGAAGWVWLAPRTPGTAPASARMTATTSGADVANDVANPPPAIAPVKTEVSPPLPAPRAESSASPVGAPVHKEDRASEAASTARLALAVSPWGEVYVDGRKMGVSPPMTELRLPPGTYTIEIRNSTFRPYRESVDLRGASNAKLKHKFQ